MNRIFNSIYIVDTAGLWLTADSSDSGAFLQKDILAVSFIGAGSGHLEIMAQSNTAANVVIRIIKDTLTNDTVDGPTFSNPFHINERLFVRTCLNGTGIIYLD